MWLRRNNNHYTAFIQFWIYTLKWVHKDNNAIVQATSQPEVNDIKSTSESSESSESQEMVVLNTKDEDNGADTSESTENSYIVDGTESSSSNSSSSSSSTVAVKAASPKTAKWTVKVAQLSASPGLTAKNVTARKTFLRISEMMVLPDPFNGILMPDFTEP